MRGCWRRKASTDVARGPGSQDRIVGFWRPIFAKHILNFSNTAATGRDARARFGLEKAPAFGYPSATDFEIVLLSIA
jgi:hypothetical protein